EHELARRRKRPPHDELALTAANLERRSAQYFVTLHLPVPPAAVPEGNRPAARSSPSRSGDTVRPIRRLRAVLPDAAARVAIAGSGPARPGQPARAPSGASNPRADSSRTVPPAHPRSRHHQPVVPGSPGASDRRVLRTWRRVSLSALFPCRLINLTGKYRGHGEGVKGRVRYCFAADFSARAISVGSPTRSAHSGNSSVGPRQRSSSTSL